MVKWQNPIVKEMDSYNIRRKGRFIELIKDDGVRSYYPISDFETWCIRAGKASQDGFSVEIVDKQQVIIRWQFSDEDGANRCLKHVLKTANRPRYLALKWFIGAIILYFALVGLVDFIHLLSSGSNDIAAVHTPVSESALTSHEAAQNEQLARAIADAETMEELQALITQVTQATEVGLLTPEQAAASTRPPSTASVIAPEYPESCP